MTDQDKLRGLLTNAIDTAIVNGAIVGDYSASPSLMVDYVLVALGIAGMMPPEEDGYWEHLRAEFGVQEEPWWDPEVEEIPSMVASKPLALKIAAKVAEANRALLNRLDKH